MRNPTYGSLDTRSQNNRIYTIDELFAHVGSFGRFQWLLDGIFCLIMIPSAYQMLIMNFAADQPSWICIDNSSVCPFNGTISSDNKARCNLPRTEWKYLESDDYSIVTSFHIDCEDEWILHFSSSIFFVAWGVGSIFIGVISDKYGRKYVLFPSLLVLLLGGLVNGLVKNIWLFVACRFITGFTSTGTGIQMFILISELVDSKHRPLAVNMIPISCSIGFCLLGLMAYFIRKWEFLFIMCTAPYLPLLLCYKFVPESIRWLYLRGKTEEINRVFKRIAKWNKTQFPTDISLVPYSNTYSAKCNAFSSFFSATAAIKMITLSYLSMISCMAYYGMSFAAGDLGGSMYRNFVLMSFIEIPAVILAIAFTGRYGRKKASIMSMFLGGVASVCIACLSRSGRLKIFRIILGMTGKLFITIGMRSILLWSLELYPTEVLSKVIGFLQVTARIGAAGAPWVVNGFKNHYSNAPFVIMGLGCIIGSILALSLPETKEEDPLESNITANLMDASSEEIMLEA